MVNRIVKLGTVVIPSSTTPVKATGSTLIPSPRWRYKGPAKTISLSYQVGRWGVVAGIGSFAGDSPIVTETLNQPASDVWKEFTPTTPLKGVALTGLQPATNNTYDMEMWFKATGMGDQRGIFTACCQVPAVVPALEIVSCSFQ